MPPCEPGTFGQAIALAEGRLAIGEFEPLGGLVTTFTLDEQSRTWRKEIGIRPADLNPADTFGSSLALHHDLAHDRWLLAVGSPEASQIAPDAGKAYVFLLESGGEWVQQAIIVPDVSTPYEWFGKCVSWATAGARTFLVIGGPGSDGHEIIGSTYLFEDNGNGTWQQQAHLYAPQSRPEDAFGFCLAAAESGGEAILIVGAPFHRPVRNEFPGAAHVYRFNDVSADWEHEGQFSAHDPAPRDQFGNDVDLIPVSNGEGILLRAAIGCKSENGNGSFSGPGGVYVFNRYVDGTWSEEARLNPPIENINDLNFGHSVSLSVDGSNRLLVGATNNREFGAESGAAYMYYRNPVGGAWRVIQALFGQQQDGYDGLAVDLALGDGPSSDMAVVGALATQCPGGSQFDSVGAVYSFDLNPGNGGECPAPVLTLQKIPDCSSGPGGEIEVRWFQATPDQRARIALLYAKRTGNFIIPNGNPCSGTSLQLGQLGLQVAYVGSAGQFGAGRLKRTVPRTVCGGYLQLVDITRCATSNVVRIE